MKVTLKPAEIAAQCNVTSNSIRNWSKEFREYLSEGANATERYYTERDATVLRYISTLKQEGMKTPEIAERLAEMKFGEAETLESPKIQPLIVEPGKAIIAPPALQESPSADFAALMALNDLRSEITAKFAALEQAKEETKRSRQRDTLFFALGLTAGIVLAVGLLAVAALMMH